MVSMTTIDRPMLIDPSLYSILSSATQVKRERKYQVYELNLCFYFLHLSLFQGVGKVKCARLFKGVENRSICRYLHTSHYPYSHAFFCNSRTNDLCQPMIWPSGKRYSPTHPIIVFENQDLLIVPMFSVGFGTRFITVVGDQGAKQQIKLQIWDTVCEWDVVVGMEGIHGGLVGWLCRLARSLSDQLLEATIVALLVLCWVSWERGARHIFLLLFQKSNFFHIMTLVIIIIIIVA